MKIGNLNVIEELRVLIRMVGNGCLIGCVFAVGWALFERASVFVVEGYNPTLTLNTILSEQLKKEFVWTVGAEPVFEWKGIERIYRWLFGLTSSVQNFIFSKCVIEYVTLVSSGVIWQVSDWIGLDE